MFPLIDKYGLSSIFEGCCEDLGDNIENYEAPVEKALEKMDKQGLDIAKIAGTIKATAKAGKKALLFLLTGIILLANNNPASAQMNKRADRVAAYEWSQCAQQFAWVKSGKGYGANPMQLTAFAQATLRFNDFARSYSKNAAIGIGSTELKAIDNALQAYNFSYDTDLTLDDIKIIKKLPMKMTNTSNGREKTLYAIAIAEK